MKRKRKHTPKEYDCTQEEKRMQQIIIVIIVKSFILIDAASNRSENSGSKVTSEGHFQF
jgi:hypothetical protein